MTPAEGMVGQELVVRGVERHLPREAQAPRLRMRSGARRKRGIARNSFEH